MTKRTRRKRGGAIIYNPYDHEFSTANTYKITIDGEEIIAKFDYKGVGVIDVICSLLYQ